MSEELVNKAVEEIGKELGRIAREKPITNPHFGVPCWTEEVLNKALANVEFDEEVFDVAEAVEDLRREQQVCVLSFTVQAMHDDGVVFMAWTLPSGVTAYLVDSWNGEPQLFAIDTEGFSDERAAAHLSTYIRAVYVGRDPEPDGPEELQISIYDVELGVETRTAELEMLIEAGKIW